MDFPGFIEGMSLTFSLIIAIGIQNAFVLKQSILGNRPLFIAFGCASVDTIMIVIGTYGFGGFLKDNALLLKVFGIGGIVFIFGYGIYSFYAAFQNKSLSTTSIKKIDNIKDILTKIFIVSVINPNAFIDSVVLMGSVSATFSKDQLLSFTLGAIAASYIWFFSLAYGATFLAPLFTKPRTWKILDFIIGCTMFVIGISLLKKLDLGLHI